MIQGGSLGVMYCMCDLVCSPPCLTLNHFSQIFPAKPAVKLLDVLRCVCVCVNGFITLPRGTINIPMALLQESLSHRNLPGESRGLVLKCCVTVFKVERE